MGGLNIYHPPTADPTTGIMYTPHARDCSAPSYLVPTEGKDQERTEFAGKSSEEMEGPGQGDADHGDHGGPMEAGRPPFWPPAADRGPPCLQAPVSGLAAYDMNTGDRLWDIPVGETPARIKNHPLLKGVDIPNYGRDGNSIQMVMGDFWCKPRRI